MASLKNQSCEACRIDAPKLTAEELGELKNEIADWQIIEVEGVPQLRRVFTFSDFKQAMEFTHRVAELAEDAGHHPAILVEWGKTEVRWWTHKIKGLHKNDAIMAAKTDDLYTV
ncbi:4a-hydroxytetrahydrobiopterin dehydratase [Teredinibacter sp. KSP-S5-2]|uniref:4a-hydroxytetrahydrobiopterin dehydratase n=1 Tax=Teredinibacter sp. KSP-S5-2 TaxID=3034506 RepID=UPI002934A0B6|nr:4a-hydroxytetrahydrobiopterin dehydratase [Teredinibacter sp. KSP-S5-2]WNO09655.1 4a-hydroxytetrahydrobiopterin dehydratase [Teredinibacter sp. KSP-S5-2]